MSKLKPFHIWFLIFGLIMISLLSKSDNWWSDSDSLEGLINIDPTWAIFTFIGGCVAFYLDKKN